MLIVVLALVTTVVFEFVTVVNSVLFVDIGLVVLGVAVMGVTFRTIAAKVEMNINNNRRCVNNIIYPLSDVQKNPNQKMFQ